MPRATINYYLKSVPKGAVRIAVVDQKGQVIKELQGSKRMGINRVTWDLRYPGARQVRLRTKPPGNPHVVEEKRFAETWIREGWYPILSWGTYGGFRGFLAAPGFYTVKLSVDGRDYTQELVVEKDPRSEGTADDIQEQIAMQMKIREDLNTVSEMVSQIEWMRKQLYDLKDVLKESSNAEILTEIDEFDVKLRAVEDELFQPTIAEGDSKSFRDPQKLYCKLSVLAGDVAESVDFAPNEQQKEVLGVLEGRLANQQEHYDILIKTDLVAFNSMLKENHISGVVVPQISKE